MAPNGKHKCSIMLNRSLCCFFFLMVTRKREVGRRSLSQPEVSMKKRENPYKYKQTYE